MGGSGAEGRTWLENGQRDPSPGCRIILCHSPASLHLAFRPQKVEASFCHWPQTQAPDVPSKESVPDPHQALKAKPCPLSCLQDPRAGAGLGLQMGWQGWAGLQGLGLNGQRWDPLWSCLGLWGAESCFGGSATVCIGLSGRGGALGGWKEQTPVLYSLESAK